MKHILLFIAALFIITSCKKDKPEPPMPEKTYLVDETLKAYLHFKPGTYWVYKDSVTGNIDTVSVVSAGESFWQGVVKDTLQKHQQLVSTFKHTANARISWYNLTTYSPFSEYYSEYSTAGPFLLSPGSPIKYHDGRLIIIPGEKPVFSGAFNFPAGIELNDAPAIDIIDRHQHNHAYTYFNFTYAKHAGIIKRTIKNDTLHQVWELVDYKIVR